MILITYVCVLCPHWNWNGKTNIQGWLSDYHWRGCEAQGTKERRGNEQWGSSSVVCNSRFGRRMLTLNVETIEEIQHITPTNTTPPYPLHLHSHPLQRHLPPPPVDATPPCSTAIHYSTIIHHHLIHYNVNHLTVRYIFLNNFPTTVRYLCIFYNNLQSINWIEIAKLTFPNSLLSCRCLKSSCIT